MKKLDDTEEVIRFRTSWTVGDKTAVVGFTDDIPLNKPVVFVRSENGRYGWKLNKGVSRKKI